jgi:hypothetical protein
MAIQVQNYITETKVFQNGGQTDANCNSLLFINTGQSDLTIDGFKLTPNQSWSILGNRGEQLVKTYSFSFADTSKECSLTVIFKRYIG